MINLYVHTYVVCTNVKQPKFYPFVPLRRPSLLFYEWATALAQGPKIVGPPNQNLDG